MELEHLIPKPVRAGNSSCLKHLNTRSVSKAFSPRLRVVLSAATCLMFVSVIFVAQQKLGIREDLKISFQATEERYSATAASMSKTSRHEIHAFGKWTFTSRSKDVINENVEAMWLAMNQLILERNESTGLNYQLIGPTSCAATHRAWTAFRLYVGDNNIHWVHTEDTVSPSPIDEEVNQSLDISVEAWHAYLQHLHGDLRVDNQFSDFRWTAAAYKIDPYIKLAEELNRTYGWPYKMLKTHTDVEGRHAWIIRYANKDGQLFETASVQRPEEKHISLFEEDLCTFTPMKSLNVSITDCAAISSDAGGNVYPGCAFFSKQEEDIGVSKLGEYIDVRKYSRDGALPLTFPLISHIASTDPNADADFFLKYFGNDSTIPSHSSTEEAAFTSPVGTTTHRAYDITALEQERGITADTCKGYTSRWIYMDTDGGPAYLHLAFHPNAPVGMLAIEQEASDDTPPFLVENFNLKRWEAYQEKVRAGMMNNSYDRFMDDHIGLEFFDAKGLTDTTNSMYNDGHPLLTRREPIPGIDGVYDYWHGGKEKFSVFFRLPVSQYIFQNTAIDVSMAGLMHEGGMPRFCDWDFCPSFFNWRASKNSRTTDGKLITWDECGFSCSQCIENSSSWR